METTLKDWLSSFWKITARPSPITFINESQKAKGKLSSAIGWLIFITIFNDLFVCVMYKQCFTSSTIMTTFVIVPLLFLFFAFCLDTISGRVFHHPKSYYDELLYFAAIVYVPYAMWSSLLSLLPLIGSYLWWASLLYPITLWTIAVKSLTKLTTWQATFTVVASLILCGTGLLYLPAFFVTFTNGEPSWPDLR